MTASRNQQIKTLLTGAFGKGKVRVRGGRGTASGWVSIKIDHSPRNWRESQELHSLVAKLINAAKIEVGTYGYDDPGSDYGYGQTMSINFAECREKADSYDPEHGWRQRLSAKDWDELQAQEAARAAA